MRAAQTSDDKEMNAFNHGRVDAAESILSFYEQEKRQARAAVPQAPALDNLVIDICRETYDRFVMGGWEPQDAHEMIREMLQSRVVVPQQDSANCTSPSEPIRGHKLGELYT
jgi:hypothetical protein